MAALNCTAHNCATSKPRDKFFCSRHWYALTLQTRVRIESAYRAGRGRLLNARLRDARRFLALREG
jgi:hypothetical protein